MKKLPDELIFGRNSKNEVVTLGQVRNITDDTELIETLKHRLITYLNNQVEPLRTHGSAFPLAVMTCVGIETLGNIFFLEDNDDKSFQFVSVTKKADQIFGRKLTKKFQDKLDAIWHEKDLKKIDCYGKVLYKFFRNTMIHGYQGKGVFLSYEDTATIMIDDQTSFITINPNWFWETYVEVFEKLFKEAIKGQPNNKFRINCLKYVRDYLLE